VPLRLPGLRLPSLRRKKTDIPDDGTMSLMEHLYEFRRRLFYAVLGIFIGTVVGFIWFGHGIPAIGLPSLSEILTGPYCAVPASERLTFGSGDDCKLLATGPFSALELQLKSALIAGAVLSCPVWLYQLWAFIVPGLLSREKKWTLIFIGAATPLFLAGVAVGYYVLPKGIIVLLGFTENGVANLQDVNQFLAFLMRFMLVFGVAFLIPLVVLMLNIIGVLKAKYLAKYRSLVVFGTFVFGAVATPSTDPFSMLALALPMTVLFLAAEVVAHILDRRKSRRGNLALTDGLAHDQALRDLSVDDPPEEQ
jgi:sec-independent protein translocase protein TatC